jgi:GTP1/Obg family GTP-binding protein
VAALYAKGAGAVEGLKQMAQALRRLPVVEPAVPTVRPP